MAEEIVKDDDSNQAEPVPRVSAELLPPVEDLYGLAFTDSEREMMLEGLYENRDHYAALRALSLPNDVPPAFVFDPRVREVETPRLSDVGTGQALSAGSGVRESLPATLEDVAFWPLTRLSALIRNRQLPPTPLTPSHLDRLKPYHPVLHC